MKVKDSRSIVRDIVSALAPLDDTEQQHIAFAQQWIDSGAPLFRIAKPADPDTHLVSYFVLVDLATNSILLTDHRKSGLWLPPGGHVELDEHPRDAVCREAQEELGVDADFLFQDPLLLTATLTVGASPHTDVSLWYVLRGDSTRDLVFDREEFNQIRWFKMEEIPYELSDPHMRRFVDKLSKVLTLASYDTYAAEYAENTDALHSHADARKFVDGLPRP